MLGAKQKADTLCRVRDVMDRHAVSHERLREPYRPTTEYQITSFVDLHGSSLDDFAEEVSYLEDALYVHDGSQESPLSLLEAYVEQHATTILSELQSVNQTMHRMTTPPLQLRIRASREGAVIDDIGRST